MKLKSIEINGFKSFADNVKLDFESNITAIIGPNGSGKSNVSDAVRWVLGEQGTKTLRANKMEDVIFSGTNEKKKKNNAFVSITFDNSDNLIPIDFKEVTISRHLSRSGESFYKINKSIVRLKEIRELFLDTGIGKEGYSLIGQGRIEEILNGKAEDRRLIFEQACGTAKIKYQKVESEKKLIKAKENLVRLKDIIVQNEKREEFLKDQSQKAKRGLELLENIEMAEFSICYKDFNNYTVNIKKYNELLTNLKNEYKDVSFKVETLKERLNPLKENLSKISNILDESSKEISSNELKKVEFLNKKQLLLERNKFITENKENILSLNKKDDESILKFSNNIKKIENEINEKSLLRKKFLENKNNINSKLDFKNNELEENIKILSDIKEKKVKIEEEISTLKSEKKACEIIKEDIEKKFLENKNKLFDLNIKKDSLLKKIDSFKIKEEETKKNILDIDKSVLDLLSKKNDFIKKIDFLKVKNLNINNEILYKDKEILIEKNYIKNYEGYNKSVKDLFKLLENEKSLKDKICGTLGELIYVDEKYKKAIESVLSSNLQGLVVNTEYDAKSIIEKMKKEKIGRLNFFPISRIFLKNEIFKLKDENILAFANDVVTCDEKYRNIIDYFLSKTVICKDLDVAVEISKKYKNKFKIVTLDADIITSWGSISGGYKSSKNNFSVIGRKDRLNTLLNEVSSLKNILDKNNLEIESFNENLSLSEKNVLKLENEKKSFLDSLNILYKEIYKNQLEIDQIEKNIVEIESYNFSKDDFSLEKEKTLDEDIKINLKLNLDLIELEDKVNFIKDEIYSLEKENLNSINDLDLIDRDINVLLNKKAEFLENKNSIEKKLESNFEKVKNFDLTISLNLEEIKKIETIISKIILRDEDLNNIILENAHLKEKLSLENEELLEQFSFFNEKFFSLKNDIEKNEIKLLGLNKDLENLISRLSDEYSIDYDTICKKMENFKDKKFTKESLKKLKDDLRNLGTFSVDSIEEYENVNKELSFQKSQEIDIKKSIEDINKIILRLESEMKKTFLKEFNNINERFSNIFKILFEGGDAYLKLDSDDILTSGIDIVARPVGKKPQSLSLLSGGEKSLTAVALLFAIFETNPSPFCILDEVDASLDDANILRYIEYLKTFLQKTQFIMITHRKPTMEMADMLYGVTMEKKGVSKVVSMKFN